MEATFLALVPPILAIVISLITKEVNLSLAIGIVAGCGMFCRFDPFKTVSTMFEIMGEKVYGNIGVLFFIIMLGMAVYLMNMSGAAEKYAVWAGKRLKTKKQSLFATMALGLIIFADDYFNCLTVGTVMRPITDRYRISREKLAYIIDSTAAPVCIVAPVSSWAAAVSSSLPDGSSINGFQLFMKTLPCNYYSWLSLGMVFFVIAFTFDFGKMRGFEKAAEKVEIKESCCEESGRERNGKVIDIILPISALIFFSIISMLYTGGFFEGGISIGDAFAGCDAIMGLAMGAFYSVIFMAVLYLPRKVVKPKEFLDGIVKGFINMVPAALILTFAWTLGGVCGSDYLNAGGFVESVVEDYSISLNFMPAIFFLIALILAFSTGTSWGTFAILLPITVSVFGDSLVSLTVITTAAVLGGAVSGDHLSPISDTTILSSTGAGCKHINHVATQMPYGVLVAGITFVCYVVSGFLEKEWIGLVLGFVLLVIVVAGIKALQRKKAV